MEGGKVSNSLLMKLVGLLFSVREKLEAFLRNKVIFCHTHIRVSADLFAHPNMDLTL